MKKPAFISNGIAAFVQRPPLAAWTFALLLSGFAFGHLAAPNAHAGPRFRAGFRFADCAPHFSSHKPFRSFGYRSHGYPIFHSSYSVRPYYPRPFPYETPRIYVVPQSHCYTPPAYTYRPAYRTVIVLGQNDVQDEGAAPESHADAWAAAGQPTGALPMGPETDLAEAWTYLERGDHQAALSAFAALANAERSSSSHRVGYALAAALGDDKITAAYALRCAFEANAEGASQVPLSPSILSALESLAGQYRQWVQTDPDNFNARFLYAAASHWIEQDVAARAVLAGSVARGDAAPSTANLLRLVESPKAAQASL